MSKKIDQYFKCCLYFSLGKMQRSINTLAEQSFKKIGIAPTYGFLLLLLKEHEKLSTAELSEALGVTSSTMTRFVDKMVTKGYCLREYEGRFSYVKITAEGEEMIPKIEECWGNLFDLYNDKFGEDKAKQLNDMIYEMNSK